MAETGNPLSRNPNVCGCCSSLADGMDPTLPEARPPLDTALPGTPRPELDLAEPWPNAARAA